MRMIIHVMRHQGDSFVNVDDEENPLHFLEWINSNCIRGNYLLRVEGAMEGREKIDGTWNANSKKGTKIFIYIFHLQRGKKYFSFTYFSFLFFWVKNIVYFLVAHHTHLIPSLFFIYISNWISSSAFLFLPAFFFFFSSFSFFFFVLHSVKSDLFTENYIVSWKESEKKWKWKWKCLLLLFMESLRHAKVEMLRILWQWWR